MKRTRSNRHIVGFVLLVLIAFVILFPLLLLIYDSTRVRQDFLSNTMGIPKALTLLSYAKLFAQDHIARYIFNSVFIFALALGLLIFVSLMTSYGIGRFNFKLKKAVLFYFLLGLMFPIQLGIIPLFIIIKTIHLFNTYASVILVLAAGMSMPVLLLTVFFETQPLAIYESAKIDGASEWVIFARIMLPIASAVIWSTCIIMSVGIWNQFFIPLVFLQSESLKTLPLLIMSFAREIFFNIDVALAASVVATVPILGVFFAFSRHIINSVVSAAVKG